MALISLHDREKTDLKDCMVTVDRADFPAPFPSGLEYSAPARGGWTIVHIGFLMPESHEIYVCGKCCLRGVVLSAAELHDTERFSTITVDEDSVLGGNGEQIIIDGVSEILEGLPRIPRAVQIFTSCIHHFLGTDLKLVFKELERRYPQVGFVQCWMNPIMRKTKLAPDPFMRKQLYALLEKREKQEKTINLIGNNFAMEPESELTEMLNRVGWTVRDICNCRDFEAYREMERSCCNLVTNPLGLPAARELGERLGQPWCYLPVSFDFGQIEENYRKLAEFIGEQKPFSGLSALRRLAKEELARTAEALKGVSVVIDYMATGRPLGLARLLLTHGIRVTGIYIDNISAEEEAEFQWLRQNAPGLELWATVHPKMAVISRDKAEKEPVLAIGQKAAYFTGTRHFVNIVEDGGLYGYGGLGAWFRKMQEAMETEKDAEAEIQVKGWNCNI